VDIDIANDNTRLATTSGKIRLELSALAMRCQTLYLKPLFRSVFDPKLFKAPTDFAVVYTDFRARNRVKDFSSENCFSFITRWSTEEV
jgi:hypothetical protein